MRRSFLLFSVAALVGCAAPGPVPPLPVRAPGAPLQLDPSGATDPRNVGTIAVLEIVMPEPGAAIGEQFGGTQFAQRIGRLHMTEMAQRRWAALARADADSLLRDIGYPVRSVSAPSSDAERAEGIRFALSANVQQLAVRTAGRTGPLRVEATATVGWELLDLAAGRVVYGRQTEGQARTTDSVDAAALRAVRQAFVTLLADTTFQRVLRTPRGDVADAAVFGGAYARHLPGPLDTVVLRPEDGNVVPADEASVRTAAAVVGLRAPDGTMATGFVVSRDGLAVTASFIVRRGENQIWARFPNGIQRRARIVRRHGRLALVQVACADPCRTVDLSLGPWPADGTPLVAVGAPFSDADAFVMAAGVSRGGCGLFSGAVRGLDLNGETLGGEPVARRDDGTVVGVVTRPGCATPLGNALRTLGIRLEPGPR